jgi:hypothetical protein
LTYLVSDFQTAVALECQIHFANANRATELTAMATALGSDATKHDKTIEAAPAGLVAGSPSNTRFTNDVLLQVNKGKGGGLTPAQMATVLTALAAAPPNPSPMVNRQL